MVCRMTRSTVKVKVARPWKFRCPSVRTYLRPSAESFPDSNEIWYVGRGQWVMHDGMPYDPIQCQGHGHWALKVWNSAIFKMYHLHHFQWELETWLLLVKLENNIKICLGRIFDIWPSLCVAWLWSSLVTQACETGTEESTVSPAQG